MHRNTVDVKPDLSKNESIYDGYLAPVWRSTHPVQGDTEASWQFVKFQATTKQRNNQLWDRTFDILYKGRPLGPRIF